MKKIFSLMLCLALVLAMAVPAFAGSDQYGFEVSEEEKAAKQERDDALKARDEAIDELEAAEDALPGAQDAADEAQSALEEADGILAEAQTAKDDAYKAVEEADKEKGKTENALQTAKEEKETADKAVTAAEKAAENAQEAVKAKEDALAEAEKATENAADNLANSKKDMDEAKDALDEAKKLKEEGSLGFFKSVEASDAVAEIEKYSNPDNCKVGNGKAEGVTVPGGEGDATTLDNMKTALEWIKEGNLLRNADAYRNNQAEYGSNPNGTSDGKPNDLKVTDLMMAKAQVNANMSAVIDNHWKDGDYLVTRVAENLAAQWPEGWDPYAGWYRDEKVHYEDERRAKGLPILEDNADELMGSANITPNTQTGHYINLINPDNKEFTDYAITGYAVNTKNGYTYNQVFYFSGYGGEEFSVEEYIKRFDEYKGSIDDKIADAQDAYDKAKAIYDEYVRNDGITDAEAKAIKDAEEALEKAKDDADKANKAVEDAKADQKAKADAVEKAEAADNEAGKALDDAKAKAKEADDKYNEAKEDYDKKIDELKKNKAAADKALEDAKKAVNDATKKRKEAGDRFLKAQEAYKAIVITDALVEPEDEEFFVGDELDEAKIRVTLLHENEKEEVLGPDDFEVNDSQIPRELTPEEVLSAKEKPIEVKFEVTVKGRKKEFTIKVGVRDYEIIENPDGTWIKESGEDYALKSDAPFAKRTEVYVDGEKVPQKNYKAEEGSTKITFKNSYMESLSPGDYKVQVFAKDGMAETKMTVIVEKQPEDPAEETPGGTGEDPIAPESKPGNTDEKPSTPESKPGTAEEKPSTPEKKPDGTDQKSNTSDNKASDATNKSETTGKKNAAPDTGDESNAILWIGLIAVSAVGVTVLRLNRKNR